MGQKRLHDLASVCIFKVCKALLVCFSLYTNHETHNICAEEIVSKTESEFDPNSISNRKYSFSNFEYLNLKLLNATKKAKEDSC